MREFVAIDFETANEQRRSACAVGLALFDAKGKLVDRYYQLLHPHSEVDYFNPVNVWVHGITAEDVTDAPQWSQISDQVSSFIGERPIVAHNMAFDGYVLSDLSDLYGTQAISNRRFCTVRLARKILADKLERKSLDEVFGYYFPDQPFDHHHAVSDAQAAGMIFARMQQEFGYEKLEELCPPTGNARRSERSGIFADQLAAEQLIGRYGNSRALEGEHVVFTGTLKHGQRAAVQQLVTTMGGLADKNLTKKTTLLVVGIPNPRSWVEGSSASRKLLKASQFRDNGSPIEVISEEEFFNRLID
uniref:exonuclease domain-containing protein n=1 Tax=Vaginimicrobium propionicum TaxID=1871034 RepID=UPI0009706BA5|nr:exonuclease domain-containing protein [Vaginimicrobium propionicum]